MRRAGDAGGNGRGNRSGLRAAARGRLRGRLAPRASDQARWPPGSEEGWEGREITAIAAHSRDPERVVVRSGRAAVAVLKRDTAVELDLHVGQPLTTALVARLRDVAAVDKARQLALRILGQRAVSRAALIDRLQKREFSAETARRVADRLEAVGLLDDEAYGRAVLRQLTLAKPAGPRLMRQKLIQKGLDRALIDRLVAEATSGAAAEEALSGSADSATAVDSPMTALDRLVARKLATMRGLDRATQARRLYGLLARRGFDYDQASEAVDRAFRSAEGDAI